MVPCKSTAPEVSFECSHHRISSTDSKVRTTLGTVHFLRERGGWWDLGGGGGGHAKKPAFEGGAIPKKLGKKGGPRKIF